MIHDHKSFASTTGVAEAYRADTAERVRRFVPMVKRLAWHVHGGGRQGIELEDLMQAGMVALVECSQRHSGPTEDGFAAYAKIRVRGAMVDLIRRHVPLSRGAVERRRQMSTAQSALRLRLGREPGSGELAEELGMTQEELAALTVECQPARLDSIDEVYSDSDMAFADQRPDSLELLANEELRGHVAEAIAALPERLQLVIQLYFVEELNLAEIAAVLEVSVPRVHQLKAQAIERLRDSLTDIASII